MDGLVEVAWREERRARLLSAAARVFARLSYDGASMDEIAAEAGVGKPTLYRYFPSKDALFTAVFVDALDELEQQLAAVLANDDGVEVTLRRLIVALVPTFRDHLVSLRFLGGDAAQLDQSKRRIFRERRSRIAGRLAEAIEAGMRRGEVGAVDATRVAHLIIGMIWSGTAAFREPDDVIAAEIAALVLGGIRGPGLLAAPPGSNDNPHLSGRPRPGSRGPAPSRRAPSR